MKLSIQKRFTFIGKSLLWSLLLYVVMMAAFNWDDIRNTMSGKSTITVVKPAQPESQAPGINTPPPATPAIAGHTGVMKTIVIVLKTISGISGHSSSH